MSFKNILITGATGYIGKNLIPRVLELNYSVRCLIRKQSIDRFKEIDSVEVIQGDLLEKESLQAAFQNIEVAFYMAHSLDEKKDFEAIEKRTTENFVAVSQSAGVKRIIYVGALGSLEEGDLSPHLRSRKMVGDILRSSGIEVIEFQASIILGAGSLSFEMIRALSERLPIMIMPKWVSVKAQPISIKDVLDYLIQAIDLKIDSNEIFEIGGPDRVSYKDLIIEYSKQRGLKRLLIPVPVLTPWLSSLWLGLVTPIFACVGRKLIESIKSSTVVHDNRALTVFPKIKPLGVKEAIRLSLKKSGPS